MISTNGALQQLHETGKLAFFALVFVFRPSTGNPLCHRTLAAMSSLALRHGNKEKYSPSIVAAGSAQQGKTGTDVVAELRVHHENTCAGRECDEDEFLGDATSADGVNRKTCRQDDGAFVFVSSSLRPRGPPSPPPTMRLRVQ